MSNKTTIETNADRVYMQFMELAIKEQKRALKAAVRTAAGQLRNTARRNLRSRLPMATHTSAKYNARMLDGVRYSKVNETKQGEIYSFVLISTTPKNKVSYRLKWFEYGTPKRTTRKGYNRGSIQALHFYNDAVTTTESNYQNTINSAIEKTIRRINATKYKDENHI